MSNGVEPIPIRLQDINGPITANGIEALIKEAFRQGWLNSRHWPNHPFPQQLFVKIRPSDRPNSISLRVTWP